MRAGFWEILLIVILVLILFGHSKIPDLMKNLANGLNVFKKEIKTGASSADKKSDAKKKASAQAGAKKTAGVPGANAKKSGVKKTSAKKQTAKK